MKYELYQFKHGDKVWNFTSHRKDIKHNQITYKSVRGLQRTAIEDESIEKCDTDITLPQLDLENPEGDNLTQLFINKIYYGGVTAAILELRDGETLVLHKGRVTQPKFDEDADTMTLVCSTAESFQNTNMLVRKFQRSCPNAIYDKYCGLSFEYWSIWVTVAAIQGLNVTFTANEISDKASASGWFASGLLLKDGVYTLITSHNQDTIALYRQHLGLKVGDIVKLAPGCDQSIKTCFEKFNNNLRFGGHPNFPAENPVLSQLIK